jgi:hypothetical protein
MTDRIDTEARLHTAMQTTLSETGRPLEDPAHLVDLEGLLYLPMKAVQDEKLRDAFRMFPADIAKQYAVEKIVELFGHAGDSAVAMGAAAIETFLYNAKNIADGDDLNAAVKREYGVGACVEFCSATLPEGFVAAVKAQFVKPGSVSPGAKAVEAKLFEAPDFAAVQATLIASCRDGQIYGFSHCIQSAEDLGTALEQNPGFAERYQNDIAFKLGADAVVWAFIHDQSAAVASVLPATAGPTCVELRG